MFNVVKFVMLLTLGPKKILILLLVLEILILLPFLPLLTELLWAHYITGLNLGVFTSKMG